MPDGYYHDEGRRLRELAGNRDVRFRWTDHALDEMAKDNISVLAVRSMLKRCSVVRCEQNRREDAWSAVGNDVNGTRITAVVVAYEHLIKIKVITAWRDKG
jgi:hypothetical protein